MATDWKKAFIMQWSVNDVSFGYENDTIVCLFIRIWKSCYTLLVTFIHDIEQLFITSADNKVMYNFISTIHVTSLVKYFVMEEFEVSDLNQVIIFYIIIQSTLKL